LLEVLFVKMSKQLSPAASASASSPSAGGVTQPIKLKKPTFVKIGSLDPESKGVNLHAKVVDVKPVLDKTRIDGSRINISEALIGDSTGVILLTCRNEQVSVINKGSSITVRNGKIDMFKNHMRLIVDQWGLIEAATTPITETINNDNNLSNTEYELVTVD